MPRLSLWITVVLMLILSISCNETTSPSQPSVPVLTASENPVTIARNYSKGIIVTGGKGSYRVKSMSDSSIVQVNFYPSSQFSTQFSQTVSFLGKKIGTTKVIIQDSAKAAEVEITVTVAVIASTPSSVNVKVNRTAYVSFMGGTQPYAIEQNANAAIASIAFNNYSMNVSGVSQGTTSITIRDNSSPANKIVIPIVVTPEPQFTTAGKLSFTSTKGDFSVNGISVQNIVNAPVNSEGAGGSLIAYGYYGNYGSISAYKKKSQTIVDLVSIIYLKSVVSAGTLPIDSAMFKVDTASVLFVFNGDISSETADIYILNSGTVTFKDFTTQHATGTFNGNGVMTRNDVVYPGSSVNLTNGLFDVPILLEDSGMYSSITTKDVQVKKYIDKIVRKEIDRMKMQRVK